MIKEIFFSFLYSFIGMGMILSFYLLFFYNKKNNKEVIKDNPNYDGVVFDLVNDKIIEY